MEPIRRGLKSYSHLAHSKKIPTSYEISTTSLDYHNQKGLAVETPFKKWHEQYKCTLICEDWNEFSDPRETTFSLYTHIQQNKEAFLDKILDSMEKADFHKSLPDSWTLVVNSILPVLRYPLHGLQMTSAYVAQMASSSRITIAALFQAADEVRKIQRFAHCTCLMRKKDPGFGNNSKTVWETGEAWQPLRHAIERLLATYSWTEAFVALNLCLKPLMDRAFLFEFQTSLRQSGAFFLSELLGSLEEDSLWQRNWTASLVRVLTAKGGQNTVSLNNYVEKWIPIAISALEPLQKTNSGIRVFAVENLEQEQKKELEALGLRYPSFSVQSRTS